MAIQVRVLLAILIGIKCFLGGVGSWFCSDCVSMQPVLVDSPCFPESLTFPSSFVSVFAEAVMDETLRGQGADFYFCRLSLLRSDGLGCAYPCHPGWFNFVA